MKSSIKFKLLPVVILGILLMGVIFGSIIIKNQQETLDNLNLNEIQTAKKTFYNLEENDVKMLKASMTDFMTNQAYKDLFLADNRTNLYDYGQDLFAKHKVFGITHFYFHRVDGTVFARIHNANKYDDTLTRTTYLKSKETNDWGTGIELGKTAFALRVVSPYYNGEELIGYIEFGEEIDHFNEIMAEQTGNEFATVVQKDFINADSWASVTETKGIRNNYADLENYVVIESTNPEFTGLGDKCWSAEKVASVSDEGNVFGKFNEDGKTYVCGGFALYDAGNNNVGAIVVIKDVTNEEIATANSKQGTILITLVLILLITGLILIISNKVIINPIKKLTEAGNKINDGDLEAKIPEIKSNDEMKDLSNTMSSLVEAIKFLKSSKKK